MADRREGAALSDVCEREKKKEKMSINKTIRRKSVFLTDSRAYAA